MQYLFFVILVVSMALYIKYETKCKSPLMLLVSESDDSDVKIAGDFIDLASSLNDDPADNEDYLLEKENGNIDKAKKLGEHFACILSKDVTDECIPEIVVGHLSDRVKAQILLLFAFAIDRGLNTYISNPLLINVAHTAFFNKMQEISSDVYDRISDTGAYSLYMLCARRGDHICKGIGESFAQICEQDGNEALTASGEMMFSIFQNMVKVEVFKTDFVV